MEYYAQQQAMAGAATRAPPGYYDSATGAFVHPGDAGAAKLASPPGPPVGVPPQIRPGSDEVYQLVQDLRVMERREHALLELSKRRETRSDLAPILWHSFGTIVALIQEIVCIYPQLSPPPTLTANSSNRVCNSLALLQIVAADRETRPLFLKAHIPLLLYPFLNTVSQDRPFEYLRLTSLGVIGALVKVDDAEVINFLLQTEIIPLCLRIMETGRELSKTVATFIVQKLLLDEMGLAYICQTADRFYAVSSVLAKMVATLQQNPQPSIRLLRHVIRCYLRLADNARAREALRQCLPECLQAAADPQMHPEPVAACLGEDATAHRHLLQLLQALSLR
jgi:CCR4-NOT transcription complex subunit 9